MKGIFFIRLLHNIHIFEKNNISRHVSSRLVNNISRMLVTGDGSSRIISRFYFMNFMKFYNFLNFKFTFLKLQNEVKNAKNSFRVSRFRVFESWTSSQSIFGRFVDTLRHVRFLWFFVSDLVLKPSFKKNKNIEE